MGDVKGAGRLGSGARSWAMHAFPLVLLSCLPAKSENRNGNCEREFEGGKLDSEEVESKWLKGGSLT